MEIASCSFEFLHSLLSSEGPEREEDKHISYLEVDKNISIFHYAYT